ncbi:MAG: hypothetical protein M0Q40_08920 [Limnochordia bacterium]|nr:hypothetical protein [Limnochordia bacterium]
MKKVIDQMRVQQIRVSLVVALFLASLILVIPFGMDAEPLPRLGSMRTVLKGTQIEEFPVEILGTFGEEDLVLIKVSEELARRCGGIAEGMSGSPVYEDGELIGALSYALNDSSNRYALVTPIERMQEMLTLLPTNESVQLDESQPIEPIISPMLTYGYTSRAVGLLERRFPLRSLGALSQVQQEDVPVGGAIEPGSAVAVQLVYGDALILAVGTMTWIDDERFLAFGHPFYHAGDVALTLSQAVVVETVDAEPLPFKLAYPAQRIGTVLQDRSAGIAGTIGTPPSYTEVCLDVADMSTGKKGRSMFHVVQDENMIIYLLGTSALSLVDRALDRVGSGTAMVDFSIESSGLVQPLKRSNLHWSSDIGTSVLGELLEAVSMLVENEFRAIQLERITANIIVWDTRQTAAVVQANAKETYYHPGDEVEVEIIVRPYRDNAQKYEVVLEVPEDWPLGSATLMVESGSDMYYYMDYLDLTKEIDWHEAVRTASTEEKPADADNLDLLISKFTDRLRNDQIQVTLLNLENEDTVKQTIDLPYVATGSALCDIEFILEEELSPLDEELLQTRPEGEEIV